MKFVQIESLIERKASTCCTYIPSDQRRVTDADFLQLNFLDPQDSHILLNK